MTTGNENTRERMRRIDEMRSRILRVFPMIIKRLLVKRTAAQKIVKGIIEGIPKVSIRKTMAESISIAPSILTSMIEIVKWS